MTTEVKIPSLGESITEAIVSTLSVKVGDKVEQDQIICELETDKVSLEVPAPVAGVIAELCVDIEDTVEVGALVAKIDENASASSHATKVVDESKVEAKATTSSMPQQPVVSDNIISTPSVAKGLSGEPRQSKETVLEKMKQSAKTPATLTAATPQLAQSWPDREALEGEEKVRMSRMRQVIAKRLKEAQNVAAMLTTFNEVDMSHIMQLRKTYQDSFVAKHDIKLGFMSFFVKASVEALKEFPAINAEIAGDNIIFKNNYHIGVAVGTEQGLVVPVVRNADQLEFSAIEREIVRYGMAARSGKLGMKDMQGGTFTITNGGVYGSLLSTPILNAPQSAILGMHSIKNRPVVLSDGSIVARPMMNLALTYDHRIVDGKEAVSFLVRIKEMIEDPQRLLLGV